MSKSCMTCSHFHPEGESKQGFCRRYPPQAFIIAETLKSAFPPVPEHFVCGEHAASVRLAARKAKAA